MGRRTSQQAKPVIGLLLDKPWAPVAWAMWVGLDDATKEHDARLFYLVGGALDSPLGYAAQENVLYDLVSAETVDDLVLGGQRRPVFLSGKGLSLHNAVSAFARRQRNIAPGRYPRRSKRTAALRQEIAEADLQTWLRVVLTEMGLQSESGRSTFEITSADGGKR